MTEKQLKEASELKELIEKFETAKNQNFVINAGNYSIDDSSLRPDTQAKIKQLLIDELEHLKDKFEEM